MMRKRIAFLAGAISFDNQSRVVDGVLKRASEMGIDVYIFTCFVNYDELEENKIGAFRIMDLPDFSTFDGVICMKNSIQYEPAARSVVNRIIKSKVPAVSIDEKINGMHYVGISDYKSQKSIVEHLINEHHLTKINYVCGILEGKRAQTDIVRIGMLWQNMAFLFVMIRFIMEITTARAAGKLWNFLQRQICHRR